jgi:hypothetical protein
MVVSTSEQAAQPSLNPLKSGGGTMRRDLTSKTAILALVALVAIATVGMKASAKSRSIADSAAVGLVDCNIRNPLSPCFDTKIGYPAGDLLVLGDFDFR